MHSIVSTTTQVSYQTLSPNGSFMPPHTNSFSSPEGTTILTLSLACGFACP